MGGCGRGVVLRGFFLCNGGLEGEGGSGCFTVAWRKGRLEGEPVEAATKATEVAGGTMGKGRECMGGRGSIVVWTEYMMEVVEKRGEAIGGRLEEEVGGRIGKDAVELELTKLGGAGNAEVGLNVEVDEAPMLEEGVHPHDGAGVSGEVSTTGRS